ncbi:MAG: phosphoglycerate kinase [Patescibacteria group bacterium]|nr:phosphoglycerate kinase [Patescibacteria group bacterium]
MKLKSLTAIRNLHCKRVLVRLDLNVPLRKKKVSDDWKIEKILPTLQYLIQKDAKVVIVSHLGRPNGKKKKKLSLQPVVNHLEKSLGKKVLFLKDKIGSKKLIKKISALNCGGVAVLENIRFYKEEEKNDKNFAKNIGELVDAYVNDAFAVSHRAHVSISAITKVLPSYAGLLLQEEIKNLDKILKNPARPFVVLLGGAKMSTKIPSIKDIKADYILLGGALDKESKSMAKKLLKKVVFPSDDVVGKKGAILDIGPQTVLEYSKYIRKAQTIVWNGPMGYFEKKEFSHGTIALARLIASRSSGKVFGVVGGGETIEALKKTKMEQYVDWISTGGGAMLSFLSGEKLPGLCPLIKK